MGQGLDVRGERSTVDVGAVMQALRERTPSITREEMAAKLIRPLGAYFAHHPRARCFLHDSGARHARFWQQPQYQRKDPLYARPLTRVSAVALARAAVALDGSIKPLLALTACLVLEGEMAHASAVAQASLEVHGNIGLGGISLLWLGVAAQCAGEPRGALPSYRTAAVSDLAPVRRAGLWGGVFCAAASDSSIGEIGWFTDRVRDEDSGAAALSFEVVRGTLSARNGSEDFAKRLVRVERALGGRNLDLFDILYGG